MPPHPLILIDTNVAYTYLTGRDDPYLENVQEIIHLCAMNMLQGFIALHSLSNIWFIARKIPSNIRRAWLLDLCTILTVIGTNHANVIAAIQNEQFADFEDCLQDKCAKEANCDFIVTANLKDFTVSEIPAISPDEFLKILKDYLGSEVESDEQT